MKKLIIIGLLTFGCYQSQPFDTEEFDEGIRENGLDDSPEMTYTDGYGELQPMYDCQQMALDMRDNKCDLCPMLLIHDCAEWLIDNTLDGAIQVAGAPVTDFTCANWDLDC